MFLTSPLACHETVQQTGQKHFRGDQQPATGWDIEQQLSASGRGCTSVIIVGNTGHEAVQEVWEIIGPMGIGNTGTEGVWLI